MTYISPESRPHFWLSPTIEQPYAEKRKAAIWCKSIAALLFIPHGHSI